jgi:hypothetical protein
MKYQAFVEKVGRSFKRGWYGKAVIIVSMLCISTNMYLEQPDGTQLKDGNAVLREKQHVLTDKVTALIDAHYASFGHFVSVLDKAQFAARVVKSMRLGWFVEGVCSAAGYEVALDEALVLKRFFEKKNRQYKTAILSLDTIKKQCNIERLVVLLDEVSKTDRTLDVVRKILHQYNVKELRLEESITVQALAKKVNEKNNEGYLIPDDCYFNSMSLMLFVAHLNQVGANLDFLKIDDEDGCELVD